MDVDDAQGESVFEVVLFEPEIPPNTGNILRLCANTGCRLHLVKPLGFRLSHRALERAGLDYGDIAEAKVHPDWRACREHFDAQMRADRLFAFSTRARTRYDQASFAPGDVLVFGPETRGLPDALLQELSDIRRLRLPMRRASRSLNLANAVAVVVYEAWRQTGFAKSDA
jgi:tRNA (cytidine/uridine-2'-O-)-methyltransferase